MSHAIFSQSSRLARAASPLWEFRKPGCKIIALGLRQTSWARKRLNLKCSSEVRVLRSMAGADGSLAESLCLNSGHQDSNTPNRCSRLVRSGLPTAEAGKE